MQLIRILNIVIASIFILLGFYHLLNAQVIQYDLVACGITNWVFSLLFYYLLVSLELTFGTLLFFKRNSKVIDILLVSYLAIISAFTMYSKIHTNFIIQYNFWGNVLLPFALIALIASSKKILKPTPVRRWISALSFIIFVGLSFAFNPIYLEDYGFYSLETSTDPKISSDLEFFSEEQGLFKTTNNLVVSFLTTGCHTCIETAKRLYITHLKTKKTEVIFIFSDTENNIRLFMDFFHFEGIKYLNISEGKFNYFSRSKTPCSYFLQNKKVVSQRIGYHSYIDLDKIL